MTLPDTPRVRSNKGSVSCGRRHNLDLYPIVILDGSEPDEVTVFHNRLYGTRSMTDGLLRHSLVWMG